MATYASPTNPFIKAPESIDSLLGDGGDGSDSSPVASGAGLAESKEIDNKNGIIPGAARQPTRRERRRANRRREQEAIHKNLIAIEFQQTAAPGDDAQTTNASLTSSSSSNSDSNSNANANANNNQDAIEKCCSSQESKESDQLATNNLGPHSETARQLADQVASISMANVIDVSHLTGDSPEDTENGHWSCEASDEITNDTAVKIECISSDSTPTPDLCHRQDRIAGSDGGILGDEEPLQLDEVGLDQAPMEGDSRRHQHIELIKKLRLQLRDLERYAYERGELERAPPSVLAERQTVILDSLKRKLPLNIDEDRMEKLELEELKCQVDKEINELIDPLITKDHLLNQLKTQLTDLERYISHLHDTLGKGVEKRASASKCCTCPIHGCSTPSHLSTSITFQSLADGNDERQEASTIMNNDTLPKTSRLIRGLMAQLICSDIKIQEAMKMDKDLKRYPGNSVQCHSSRRNSSQSTQSNNTQTNTGPTLKPPTQYHDSAVWNIHIDKVILATDSLTNLFGIEPNGVATKPVGPHPVERIRVDQSLVDSVVRRQLVPSLRDMLSYGLIDPNSLPRPTYRSFLFDPYFLISSLTCLPGTQSYSQQEAASLSLDKIHVWNVIEDYFNSRNEPQFKTSSVKTLSQSFNLTPSMDGPIKVTSKQALLIAVDDIIERLSKCKPNGPDSHFKMFVYTALNQRKLATWIKIVFRSKSGLRKFYHSFSFVNQPDKMEKFLQVIDVLNQIEFKLKTDNESFDQFVGAF